MSIFDQTNAEARRMAARPTKYARLGRPFRFDRPRDPNTLDRALGNNPLPLDIESPTACCYNCPHELGLLNWDFGWRWLRPPGWVLTNGVWHQGARGKHYEDHGLPSAIRVQRGGRPTAYPLPVTVRCRYCGKEQVIDADHLDLARYES